MMYQQILDINSINERSECIVVWFSAIQAAEILMAQYSIDGQRSRERVNAVEVENYGGERYRSFKDLTKWLKSHPPLNCTLGGSLFHFGGTYTQADDIYTLKYLKSCICSCWPHYTITGYTLNAEYGIHP
jgi:hypothetical protein